MIARLLRTFEQDTAGGSTRQRLTLDLDFVSVPRRGDRVSLPELPDDALAVERTTLIARAVSPSAGTNGPRVILHLAPEPADRLPDALASGWTKVR